MEFSVRHLFPAASGCICRRCAASASSPRRLWSGCKRSRASSAPASTSSAPACHRIRRRAIEGVLRATLGRLSLMSLDELQAAGRSRQRRSRPRRTPAVPQSGRPPIDLAPQPAALPTVSLLMAFSAQSGGAGHQHAADVVERLSDRAAGLAGMAPRGTPQCRFPRHAGDRGLAHAGQSDGRRNRHLADQARRLDPRSDRGRLAPRDQRTARISDQDRLGHSRWRRHARSRPPRLWSATRS